MNNYIQINSKAAPLAVFRILFGVLMCFSMIRFWWNGWIEKIYINPSFHFHYQGFEWVQVPGQWCYLLFLICAISALGIAVGWFYKINSVIFFLSFSYIELMEKASYLNHYYFISVVACIMIFLPAHHYYSYDAYKDPKIKSSLVPKWSIDILKLMLAIVYIYAGAAKLNYDWMIDAMPLSIWLPSKTDLPIIGSLMQEKWLHYAFSWGGAIYDLVIVFLLLFKRTRWIGFAFVVIFHVLTRILFPIGMFPFIMIFSTLIYFDSNFHEKLLGLLPFKKYFSDKKQETTVSVPSKRTGLYNLKISFLALFMCFQILFPLRYLLHDGNVFWNEKGYRFAWRVMLMEKTGMANFKIVNHETGKRFYVQNEDFLTPLQQKQMSTQADMIWEYGQYLGKHFESQGHEHVGVYVENVASLNGKKTQTFIKPDVDLMRINRVRGIFQYIEPLHE